MESQGHKMYSFKNNSAPEHSIDKNEKNILRESWESSNSQNNKRNTSKESHTETTARSNMLMETIRKLNGETK